MKTFLILALMAAIATVGLIACAPDSTDTILPVSASGIQVKKTMKPFKSEQELARYFRTLTKKQRDRARMEAKTSNAATLPAPAATMETSAAKPKRESVTNTQHTDVDEGDIVKVHGDHLIVLRRGRLFTVAIGEGALKPISTVEAFGPDINPSNTWYDEMLVSENTIVVIGYSYERGGTEVGLFDINDNGRLLYRSTYHLRSDAYYSSRNYASRLIGNKLIFYAPQYLDFDGEDPLQAFPAVRKWRGGPSANQFRRIVPATRVYRPETEFEVYYGAALHSVTVCDLANGGFDCQATSTMGPPGHVFYVSPDAVYVWASSWEDDGSN